MTEIASSRRLAAIVVADVVGYSRLLEADEAGVLTALKQRWSGILEPVVQAHGGRVVKYMGDGALMEFSSAVNAVSAALAVQEKFAAANASLPEDAWILLRIGINLGEVVGEGSDIFGEGVNIASRLEALAAPGGLCISAKVLVEVTGKIDGIFEDIGAQSLKNVTVPVRAYRSSAKPARPAAPATPIKPSIAVLAFQNMTGDPEQEYFVDGMVDDIITALSRSKWLFVIARDSSFTYKGRIVDIKQVGRELGVRYVLEGSVRKAGSRVRISGQLIDSSTGGHLWADRFEGALEDVFALQDRITASVVGAIAPKLQQAEIDRSKRKPTDSLDAYDYYLRGLALMHTGLRGSRQDVSEALRLFSRAAEIDGEFAAAYGMAAWCHVVRNNYGWASNTLETVAEVGRLARKAIALGRDDAVALYTGGFALAQIVGNLQIGAANIDRALALDPNSAAAWHLSGWVRLYLGDPETAVAHMARAMRLDPLGPMEIGMINGTAAAHFLAGRYDEAAEWAERAVHAAADYAPALRMAAASFALSGKSAQAKSAMDRMRRTDDELRCSTARPVVPFRGERDIVRYIEGLRRAGLPE